MRLSSALLPFFLQLATALDPTAHPFLHAIPIQIAPTSAPHPLLARQEASTACPTSFTACSALGAPNLCCASGAAVCSADYAGNVACCPSGAACSGTIGGIITSGTVNVDGSVVNGGGGGVTASTSADTGLVIASSTTTTTSASAGGFVLVGSSTVATVGSSGGKGVEVVSLSPCLFLSRPTIPLKLPFSFVA